MEQIQIRQPKMVAAQSFIQNLGAFLTIVFILIAEYFLLEKINSKIHKTVKLIGITQFNFKKT